MTLSQISLGLLRPPLGCVSPCKCLEAPLWQAVGALRPVILVLSLGQSLEALRASNLGHLVGAKDASDALADAERR